MTEEEREIRNFYRNTFMSPAGRRTLAHMLTELGFFNTASNDEEVTLQNYAKVLLNHLGILTAENVLRMSEALLNVPVWDDEPQTEGDR
jgi:hypothetical protein